MSANPPTPLPATETPPTKERCICEHDWDIHRTAANSREESGCQDFDCDCPFVPPLPAKEETPLTGYDTDAERKQRYWRQQAKAVTEGRGFTEGGLQWLWRSVECFGRKYDTGEVVAAICDALTREGQTAWPGDGTSCVEQMIRLQWERAEKAEATVREQQQEIERLRAHFGGER